MTPTPRLLLLAALTLSTPSLSLSINDVLSSYSLTQASFNFSVPATTLNSDDATSWIASNWDINGNKPDWGNSDIVFSPDPSTSTSTLVRRAGSSTSVASSTKTSTGTSSSTTAVTSPASTSLGGQPPVLRIEYPQGSYSKRTGGTQFYAQPLNNTGGTSSGNTSSDGQYERMLLAYDVWFPTGFAWNQGGKLPGLRGGPDTHGCSGGNQTDGTGCFSTRLMWRTSGAGEVYAYVPTTQSGFCSQSQITCNSDYGTSLARGSFSFATGKWQTIWLLVMLNEVGTANGVVQLYYNGVQALSFTNLELRSASSISSIGGMFFSTFFGGDDSSWATPTTQYTYFRNMALYAGFGAANGTGSKISAASRTRTVGTGVAMGSMSGVVGVVGVVGAFVGLFGVGLGFSI